VVRLLQRVANMSFAAPFTASLPVAGVSGTLQRRMRGTAAAGACRAKTGTLRYTSNLAGYCTTGDGGVVAFALLMNGVNVGRAHDVQDRIAAALARWDGLGTGPTVAPPAPPAPSPEQTGGGASARAKPGA
jgi:D-alanyl-D-alanine carboxypeptidase